MRKFSTEIEIQAPSDRVWAVMRDVERWPEWTWTMTSIELLGTGPFGVGSKARVRQPKLPPAVWEVTEFDEGRKRFTWVSRSPGVRVTGRHWVEGGGPRSQVGLSIEFSGWLAGLVALMMAGLSERYIGIEAAGLKARCEKA